MSRRVPAGSSSNAAQNQQTLKTLVKIESNKSCADCKRNKHPRWASWNLGIFVCIRCSGIHRGMGTHISRVKSVDLDAWTDEQLHSMLRWGNARANKYWEAKLAPGHIPSEAKIENFIRTKYESKRWAMDGGLPDPTTLDVNEEDHLPQPAPISAPNSGSTSTLTRSTPAISKNLPGKPAVPSDDIFGEDTSSSPSVSAGIQGTKPPRPAKRDPPVSKQLKPADSLLGFDFFGPAQSAPPMRPTSAGSSQLNANVPSRPDLKQSILSLYASNQKVSSPASHSQAVSGSFADLPNATSQPNVQQPTSTGLDDAFHSLSFGTTSLVSQPQASLRGTAVSTGLASPPQKPTGVNAFNTSTQSSSVGGNFFNSRPLAFQNSGTPYAGNQPTSQQFDYSSSTVVGEAGPEPTPSWTQIRQATTGNGSSNYSELPNVPSLTSPGSNDSSQGAFSTVNPPSVFNLSHATVPAQLRPAALPTRDGIPTNTTNPWESNDTWHIAGVAAAAPSHTPKTNINSGVSNAWAWDEAPGHRGGIGVQGTSGAKKPAEVVLDEDFGGWESSTNNVSSSVQASRPTNELPAPARRPNAFNGGGDDLFSNVWE